MCSISQTIDILNKAMERYGDLEVEFVTGKCLECGSREEIGHLHPNAKIIHVSKNFIRIQLCSCGL